MSDKNALLLGALCRFCYRFNARRTLDVYRPAVGFGLGFMGDTKLMRGSHGSHEGYGGGCCGGGHMQSKKVEKGARDPVCGMEVNEKTTKYKAEFKGKTYHFCSSMCRSTFKKDPGSYAK